MASPENPESAKTAAKIGRIDAALESAKTAATIGAVGAVYYACIFGVVYGWEKLSQSSEAQVAAQGKKVQEAKNQLTEATAAKEATEQRLGTACVSLVESYVDGGLLERQGYDGVAVGIANNPANVCGSQVDWVREGVVAYVQGAEAVQNSYEVIQDEQRELESDVRSMNRSEAEIAKTSALGAVGVAVAIPVFIGGALWLGGSN